MDKDMEKEKNMEKTGKLHLKENIEMEKDGMQKDMILKKILNMI